MSLRHPRVRPLVSCAGLVGLVTFLLLWPVPGPLSGPIPGPLPGTLAGPIAGPVEALANGGTLRLANVPMGAYLVSVFTDPTPVRPDSLDVSVLVVNRTGGEVVDGLDVRVRTRHLGGAVADDERRATREQADDPRYYAAKFGLGAEGEWEIRVVVEGPEGSGDAGFQVRARDRGLLGHPLVLVVLALLPLVLVGGWIVLQSNGTTSVSRDASR
ncbi:MAG: hypothetical protein EA350_06000 [Gemmatimonadales bacterium]|nr:MAG: hypothetical protein EA350_06000 [Gemmatimonadales bacterium]